MLRRTSRIRPAADVLASGRVSTSLVQDAALPSRPAATSRIRIRKPVAFDGFVVTVAALLCFRCRDPLSAQLEEFLLMATLVLIDDDESVRVMLALALTRAGHQVLEAGDGQQGLELARASGCDMVITDLVMPVQEGVETIMALRRERPRVPIIAISGGARHSSLYLSMAEKIGADRVLAKPFLPQQLVDLVSTVLAEPRSPVIAPPDSSDPT
jgi:two-component system, chemotaxis family, chemotaxis protein CheY